MPETNERIKRILTKFRVADNGCHEWAGACNQFGYGQALIRIAFKQYRNIGVHRLAWEARNGPIHKDGVVMHTCDNRRCINPDHLQLGTIAANNADARAKGRSDTSGLRNVNGPTYRAPSVPTPPGLTRDKLKIWQTERP